MNNVYETKKFNEIYENVEDFITDFNTFTALKKITETSARTTWYLLTARYGSSPISNQSVDLFKIKVFSLMYQYGPSWEKKLSIQETVRNLSVSDLQTGNKVIYNKALNPDTAPSTSTTNEISYINEQTVQKTTKSPLQAYNELKMLLEDDVTEFYISKFKKLFRNVVLDDNVLLYANEED